MLNFLTSIKLVVLLVSEGTIIGKKSLDVFDENRLLSNHHTQWSLGVGRLFRAKNGITEEQEIGCSGVSTGRKNKNSNWE